jgi:hypothetical protein
MTLEIFAGPIVRKVTPAKVCIWIAVKLFSRIEVKIFSNEKEIGGGLSQSISLRDHLFIHLAEALPLKGSFPLNQELQYSIGIPAGNSFDYSDFENLVVTDRLAYGNEKWYEPAGYLSAVQKGERPSYPRFIIQGSNSKLNIAVGSCRKMHDKGNDAFLQIDTFLRQTYADVSKRPHVLYLTGDQIYADDVDQKYTLPAVISLSQQLLLIEQLPKSATHTMSYLKRTQIIKDAGFTSEAADGHLLGFGEFIAMYGLSLNGNNWRGFVTGDSIADFVQSLTEARRVLANTATYMIFDDHDVTDDWFITNRWKKTVLSNPNGKRIIANAMATYFLMQAWGNCPENFNFTEIKEIIEAHVNIGSDKKDKSPFDDYFLRLSWEYAAPTFPTSYFLNTRTERDGDDFPPILKSKASWDKSVINVTNKNFPFVLIAPGPLLNFPGTDSVQQSGAAVKGFYYADYESWMANPINFRYFFEYFKNANISKIVVLSGDVHYSYSAIFSVYNKEHMLGSFGGYKVKCLQITSSAMKNSAGPGQGSILGAFATVPFTGTLYLLFFRDNTIETACDKTQAEQRVLANRREKLLGGSAFTPFPNFGYSDGKLFALSVTGLLPGDFAYMQMGAADYPDLIIELTIKSQMPKTADYIAEHNYCYVSIAQNSIEYSFSNRETLNFQL